MAYALSIQQILNTWAEQGVFSYLFPFLIVFAVVFAILQKTKIFGDATQAGTKNVSAINAIIAISVGLLSLLNDYVPTFFASLMPKFGIAISLLLVILVLVGLFFKQTDMNEGKYTWIGWILGVLVIIWAWSEWNDMFGGGFEFNYFLEQYFWGLILLVALGGLAYWLVKEGSK